MTAVVFPPALATDDYLDRFMSALGIRTWTNHDETNDGDGVQELIDDANENAAVSLDAKVYAGTFLGGRLSNKYEYTTLQQAPLMIEIWAVVCLRTLCFRRGNPPPKSLEARYQEIVEKDGLLDQIASGKMKLTDVYGTPLPPKNPGAPSHANLQIDRRYPESSVRVVTGSSDTKSSPLGRKFDRYTEFE